MHGDKNRTLSLSCEQQIEAEANFAAGRLLFLQDLFQEHFQASQLSLDTVKELGGIFGNTITSTLWRAVECADIPMFGLVSQHPRRPHEEEPLRYFIRSPLFREQFGQVAAMQLFRSLPSFCSAGRGPLGKAEIRLTDGNGDRHIFYVEVFFNSYEALTLGVYRRATVPTVAF